MKIVHRSKLKRVEFTFAIGDIFDASVDAIVSSEQTDFVLSGNPESLSGQIWKRYGETVQRQLDAATKRQVLGPGSVIDTSAGEDFKRIFHAGFHDPDDWPDLAGEALGPTELAAAQRESRETNYFAAIGSCMAQILDFAVAKKLKSVAFPLIGCGLFGLDEKMLILQFLDAVEEFDNRLSDGEKLHVWLVIRDSIQFVSAAGTFLDLLMQARSKLVSVRVKPSGVPILDRFANHLLDRANDDWAKWQLCRYAEIAAEFMCYAISRASRPPVAPESLFEENRAPTFGLILEIATHLACGSKLDRRVWGIRFFCSVLLDAKSAYAIGEVNHQRNNLAHGRQSASLPEIKKLVTQGLQLESWVNISDADGELRLTDWRPWVETSPSHAGQIGLLERWQKNALRYLVPETGEIFQAPRDSCV